MTTPAQASGEGATGDRRVGGVEPRPKKLTKAMSLMAAGEIANELSDAGLLRDIDPPQACTDIAQQGASRLYVDGYQLAKDLEENCEWECNLQIAKILDGYGAAARKQIDAAEKDWAARTDPQPPYPIGQRVKISNTEAGEITAIYKYGTAEYEVKIDGDANALPPHNSRRIILFEDAKAEGRRSPDTTSHSDGR